MYDEDKHDYKFDFDRRPMMWSSGNVDDQYDSFEDKIEMLAKGEWWSKGKVLLVEEMELAHIGRALSWCRNNGCDDTDAYLGLKEEYTKRKHLHQDAGDSF